MYELRPHSRFGLKYVIVQLLITVPCLGIAAFGLTRLIGDLLYDISPADPATYACLALLMFVVALAASYLPARRATQIDPMVALRAE